MNGRLVEPKCIVRRGGFTLVELLVVIAVIGMVTDFDGRAAIRAFSEMHYGLMGLAVLMLGLRVLFGAWRLQPPVAGDADGSRERWLRDVRESAEERGFGWAHWAYTSPFGIVANEETRALDDATIEALGLTPSP